MVNRLPKETARVVNSQKLEDRFLKTEIFTPTDRKKREKGSLYFLIEILNPWHPSAQIADMIVKTVKKEYYRVDERPAACFERALQNVNQNLSNLVDEGETGWMNNLNGIIAAVVGDRIYLTYTGNVEAYLFRDEKISRIVANAGGDQGQYPFIELTNGKIQLGDRFVFSNSDLFDFISLDTLRDVTKTDGAKKAAQYIKDVLSRERQQSINAILIKVNQPSKASAELPDVVALDRSDDTGQSKVVQGAREAYRQGLPVARKWLIKLGRRTTGLIKRANKFLGNFVLNSEKDSDDEKVPVKGWDRYTGQSIKKEGQGIKAGPGGFLKTVGQFISQIDKRWLIIVAVALIIIVGASVFYIRQNNNQVSLADQISQIQKMIDSAETKVALHQKVEARELLLSAQDQLASLSDESQISTEVNSLSKKVEEVLYSLDKIVSVDAIWKDLNELNQGQFQTGLVAGYRNKLYLANQDYGQIFSIRVKDKKTKEELTLPQKAGKIERMIAIDTQPELLIQTENKIYHYDLDNGKVEEQDINLPENEIQALATYSRNLYLLEQNQGVLWRYLRGSIDYAPGRPLINDPSIKDSRSIAIDGDIYFLVDNKVIRFSVSELAPYRLKNLPDPDSAITQASMIYTQSELKNLYLVDDNLNRVIEYQKKNTGQYQKQYRLPEVIENISVVKGKLYILSESNRLYKAN